MLIYPCVAAGLRRFLRSVYAVRVEGGEHVPSRGAVVLCANHRHWWDIPIVGVLLGRQVSFMAKAELFRYPVFGPLLRRLGAFPVHRGAADRQAFRRAFAVLAAGGALGIFVEGTRSRTGNLGRGRPGAAFIALKADAPVVPVAIAGAYRRGGGLVAHVGPALDLSAFRGRPLRSGELETVAEGVIMGAIAQLLGLPSRSASADVRGTASAGGGDGSEASGGAGGETAGETSGGSVGAQRVVAGPEVRPQMRGK